MLPSQLFSSSSLPLRCWHPDKLRLAPSNTQSWSTPSRRQEGVLGDALAVTTKWSLHQARGLLCRQVTVRGQGKRHCLPGIWNCTVWERKKRDGCRVPGTGNHIKPCTQSEWQPKMHCGGKGNGNVRKTEIWEREKQENRELAIPPGHAWKEVRRVSVVKACGDQSCHVVGQWKLFSWHVG